MTALTALAADAWHFFGFGVGQVQIIAIGLIIAVVLIVSYRYGTRGKRYGRG